MWLLVDMENVMNNGFQGVEYLTPEDGLVIFYSAPCGSIRRDIMEKIGASGCSMDCVRLERTGKNALDFYITSYIAELACGDACDEISVISKDRGFQAVLDYWVKRKPRLKIHFQPNILLSLKEEYKPGPRRDRVRRDVAQVPIAESMAKMRRVNWLREELSLRLEPDCEIDFQVLIEKLLDYTPGQKIYRHLLHEYGIHDGLIVYQVLREMHSMDEMKVG